MIYNISKKDMSCGRDELIPNYVTWGCRVIYYSRTVDMDAHRYTFVTSKSFKHGWKGLKKKREKKL
jgi:hypothetical protein